MIQTLEWEAYAPYFSPRPKDAHKGQAGHVLIVGGYLGMTGSVRLAAMGAYRVGAGLVTIATHPQHAAFLNADHPEIMCYGVDHPDELTSLLIKAAAIVLGPGMGQSIWAKNLWDVLCEHQKPMVLDADGLNILASHPRQSDHWVLTPHAGEAARLLGIDTAEVQQDRQGAARAITERYGGICVLKGAGSLIHDEVNGTMLCPYGNPGMATAGMGDVLAGVIGSLIGQGLPLSIAAQAGVLLHAKAGDRAAEAGGQRGMIASDLFPFLRQLVN